MSISKVVKIKIAYISGCGEYDQYLKEMWKLQRDSRTILNKATQILYNYDCRDLEHYKETGENLDIVEETGYKRIDGYVYDILKKEYTEMSSNNLCQTVQAAWKKYKYAKDKIFKGEASVPSYKGDQPVIIQADRIKLSYTYNENGKDEYILDFPVFSRKYCKEKGYSRLKIQVFPEDNYQFPILTRLLSGEYKFGNCQIIYKKKKWYIYITYNFEKKPVVTDSEKILGIDLGETIAAYASVYGSKGGLKIMGGEVTEFAKRMDARIKSMQNQAKRCGSGRVGHGTKKRVEKIYKHKDKVANFRDTTNHKISNEIVKYAIKNGCGIIQMEDLSKIKDVGEKKKKSKKKADATGEEAMLAEMKEQEQKEKSEKYVKTKLLKHWTYYDLQHKIETKANACGIEVIKVNPMYTSQRCSKCGYIHKGNRKTQADFRCLRCGHEDNADHNASQNLAIKDIDLIISSEIAAMKKEGVMGKNGFDKATG